MDKRFIIRDDEEMLYWNDWNDFSNNIWSAFQFEYEYEAVETIRNFTNSYPEYNNRLNVYKVNLVIED